MSAKPRHQDLAAGDVAVALGEEFVGRSPGGGRRVRVLAVEVGQGSPRASVSEIAPACAHPALAALSGGACPACPRVDARPFVVALTWDGARWRMPAAYEVAA